MVCLPVAGRYHVRQEWALVLCLKSSGWEGLDLVAFDHLHLQAVAKEKNWKHQQVSFSSVHLEEENIYQGQ